MSKNNQQLHRTAVTSGLEHKLMSSMTQEDSHQALLAMMRGAVVSEDGCHTVGPSTTNDHQSSLGAAK